MLADLDETLRKILKEELLIKNSEIEVSFDQPRRENTAKWQKPTLNLFLYDLRENPTLRAHQWEHLPSQNQVSPGNGRQVSQKRTPFRVDCFYMLTAWASDPQDEHRLLTRCMLALFRFPILPEEQLIGTLRNPPFDIQARLASHDKLTNPAEVWSALDNEIRPSISYIVTLALDPWTEITGPAVSTLRLHSGQAEALPKSQRLVEGTRSEMIDIGGTVRDRAQDGLPLSGIEVAVKGTGLFTKSDEEGRFILGSLSPGEYTLVAWPTREEPGMKPIERQISVPAKQGDYDIEIGKEVSGAASKPAR
jgi:hypothetical protein